MVSDLNTFIRKRNAQVLNAMQAELENAMVDAKTYHLNAVRNWKGKPKWQIRSVRSKQQLGANLEVGGEMRSIWTYVDQGTGKYGKGGNAYWIFPRSPGGKLQFQTGYDAKTRPTAKANVGTGARSGGWVQTDAVLHPGIKPRDFSKTYKERVLIPNLKSKIVKQVRRL
jgi:hypothetical protein